MHNPHSGCGFIGSLLRFFGGNALMACKKPLPFFEWKSSSFLPSWRSGRYFPVDKQTKQAASITRYDLLKGIISCFSNRTAFPVY
jgi:hypothetical protein